MKKMKEGPLKFVAEREQKGRSKRNTEARILDGSLAWTLRSVKMMAGGQRE